jgi:hypothetical protein
MARSRGYVLRTEIAQTNRTDEDKPSPQELLDAAIGLLALHKSSVMKLTTPSATGHRHVSLALRRRPNPFATRAEGLIVDHAQEEL